MARTKAISLIQSGSTKVDLAELSGLVISNIQKDTLSQGLKSQAYTGNPASGSVEFKRFKNSASQPYGTARTAGKCDAITVPPTTVNLNTHKEIVEEAAKFDLDTFGVGNIMTGHKTTGANGSGSMTLYYMTPLFREMLRQWKETGKDVYFDMVVENDDQESSAGKQTVLLMDCNLDSVVLAKLDGDSDDALDEDADFTFEDFDILTPFTKF